MELESPGNVGRLGSGQAKNLFARIQTRIWPDRNGFVGVRGDWLAAREIRKFGASSRAKSRTFHPSRDRVLSDGFRVSRPTRRRRRLYSLQSFVLSPVSHLGNGWMQGEIVVETIYTRDYSRGSSSTRTTSPRNRSQRPKQRICARERQNARRDLVLILIFLPCKLFVHFPRPSCSSSNVFDYLRSRADGSG